MKYRALPSFALAASLSLASLSAFSQAPEAAAPIERGQIRPTPRGSGREMFATYCAACHGLNGKGHGPAAPALKGEIADLSLLARRNEGRFPTERVTNVLRFGVDVTGHGSSAMPVWGPLLRSLNPSQEADVQLRIANLVRYVESLQDQPLRDR